MKMNPQTESSTYCYQSLPSLTWFRILELLPESDDSEFCYKLILADWNNPPKYEAISYACKRSELTHNFRCPLSLETKCPNSSTPDTADSPILLGGDPTDRIQTLCDGKTL